MKRIAVVVSFLTLVTLVGLRLNRSVSGARAIKAPAPSGRGLRRAELTIEGMWCVSCATGAEYSLKALEGVEDAHVGFTGNLGGEGWVVYREGKVSEEEIVKAVEPYKAVVVSDRSYSGMKER